MNQNSMEKLTTVIMVFMEHMLGIVQKLEFDSPVFGKQTLKLSPNKKTAISYSINQALADFNTNTFISKILKLVE